MHSLRTALQTRAHAPASEPELAAPEPASEPAAAEAAAAADAAETAAAAATEKGRTARADDARWEGARRRARALGAAADVYAPRRAATLAAPAAEDCRDAAREAPLPTPTRPGRGGGGADIAARKRAGQALGFSEPPQHRYRDG